MWGIGLVLIVEGVIYALAPHIVESLLRQLSDLSMFKRRQFGIWTAITGVFIILIVKRFF